MASLVVAGDTSGSVTLAAPAISGSTTLTLPTTTGTLVVTGGAQTIEFADGTVSAPSITNSGDTNTGIFFPAADTIAFTEGGVESMRIDSSGNVGIGTTSVTSGWRFEAKGGLPAIFNADSTASTATYGGVAFYRPTNAGGQGNGIQFALNNSSSTQVEYAYIGGLIETNTAGSQNGAIIFAPASAGSRTERMRLNSNGNLVLSGGTNNANGIGITFPISQSASSDANCLDDYEEGTWTPVIKGTTADGTASYAPQNGRYTKVGRMVFVELYIVWTGGTGTGNLFIDGLPFTSAGSATYPSLAIGYWDGIAITLGQVPMAYVNNGSTRVDFVCMNAGGAGIGTVPYDGAGGLQIAGCYTVA
jgi:hypothetical protein